MPGEQWNQAGRELGFAHRAPAKREAAPRFPSSARHLRLIFSPRAEFQHAKCRNTVVGGPRRTLESGSARRDPKSSPSARHRLDSWPPARGLSARVQRIAPSWRKSARECPPVHRPPAHDLEPAETPAIACGRIPQVHRVPAAKTILAAIVPRFSFALTIDGTSPEGSGYDCDANRTEREYVRHDNKHSPDRSLCGTLRWHPRCGRPAGVHARACDARAEWRMILAGTPRCGTALLRCVRCFRRNEPDNDALLNCWEKLPVPSGKTRWSLSLQSVRVLHPAPHRRSRARSKDPGREGSPLRRHKWPCGTLRICRGLTCLQGIPPAGRGFQSVAAQLQ